MASKTFYDCGCMEQGDQVFACAQHRTDKPVAPPLPAGPVAPPPERTAAQYAMERQVALELRLAELEARAGQFLAAAEAYRIHSELSFSSPISYTVEMMEARNALWAALAVPPEAPPP